MLIKTLKDFGTKGTAGHVWLLLGAGLGCWAIGDFLWLYYEAVLQLRGSEEKVRKMQSRIEKKIGEMRPLHKGAFISEQGIKKVLGGIDIRIGSKEIAWKLAMDIKSLYKTEIKKSYTLVGARQGSRIYRTTILMRARE